MSAVRAILPKKWKTLMRYATKIEGEIGAAEELAAETILRALEKEFLFKPGTNINAWLWTIMKNIKRDQFRRMKRRKEVSLDALNHFIEPSYTEDVDGLSDPMLNAIKSLDVHYRKILIAVVLDDLSYKATAIKFDIPIGTVMSRLSRAKQKLREALEDVDIQTSNTRNPEKAEND